MKIKLIIIFLLLAQLTFSQHSKPALKTTLTTLLEQVLTEEDLANNMVRMETVVFPPGYSSVKHTHPCPLFVYVLEGELLSEFEGVKKVYKVGDTFYEKANGIHSITKNNSATTETKILVFYLMMENGKTFNPVEH